MSDVLYRPKRGEIIALTLIGFKLPDGRIRLDDDTILPEWPRVVSHHGIVVGFTNAVDRGVVSGKFMPDRAGWISQEAVYDSPIDGEE